eukprot:m.40300 g.40300  ORF g.40300 m.40300 type:complete len:500 (+) comp11354_c0_seq1:73-1572(+)
MPQPESPASRPSPITYLASAPKLFLDWLFLGSDASQPATTPNNATAHIMLRLSALSALAAVVVQLQLLVAAVNAGGSELTEEEKTQATWNSFVSNILSFAIVVGPAALLVAYVRKNPSLIAGPSVVMSAARTCILGSSEVRSSSSSLSGAAADSTSGEKKAGASKGDVESGSGGEAPSPTLLAQAMRVSVYVLGLQGSYLTWGVLQEQIMTQSYGTAPDGSDIHFKNSQYLVFINRVLALCVAFAMCRFTPQPPHNVPLYPYSFPSISNVMSSWCQYEALKFVSFPTQVLAKASKIIPVMLMGKVVQGKTYPPYEYACAALLSVGVAMFMFARAEEQGKLDSIDPAPTSTAGILLLLGYMVFDSFTSNYQAHLFKQHSMSSYQMMFGVNMFSCFFTLFSLLQQGTFFDCVQFTLMYPKFMFHGILLSLCSATGQVFIFKTLSDYGALVFAIIMTTRQVISIVLSAVIFGHSFATQALLGIFIVFVAMFGRIYLRTQNKK